jgi:hypothetical protein
MSTQKFATNALHADMMLLKLLEQEYLFIKLVRTYSITQSMRQIYLAFLNQDLFIPV